MGLVSTLFSQYRFPVPDTTPYVGLGLTYAYFYGTHGTSALTALTGGTVDAQGNAVPTTFTVDSKWALSPQVGLAVRITDATFLDFMYAKSFVKSKARLSTGQIVGARLDPDMWSMQISYKF